jgi:uncharacterized protein YukE
MTFEVTAEELTAHASHLDGLTDRIQTAISAAEQVSMADEAYGLLCSFLPPIVNPMEEEGLNALKAAQEGVGVTADNVRETAKQYQETDDASAESFSPLREGATVNESAVALRGVPAAQNTEPLTARQAPEGFERVEPLTARQAPEGFERVEPLTARQAPEGFERAEPLTARQAPEGFERAEPLTARQAPEQGISARLQGTLPTEPAEQGMSAQLQGTEPAERVEPSPALRLSEYEEPTQASRGVQYPQA